MGKRWQKVKQSWAGQAASKTGDVLATRTPLVSRFTVRGEARREHLKKKRKEELENQDKEKQQAAEKPKEPEKKEGESKRPEVTASTGEAGKDPGAVFTDYQKYWALTLMRGYDREKTKDPAELTIELLRTISYPEFYSVIQSGKRTITIDKETLTADLRTPLEKRDQKHDVWMREHRKNLAKKLKTGKFVEFSSNELDMIISAMAGQAFFTGTNERVWTGWEQRTGGQIASPPEAFFSFLELFAKRPKIAENEKGNKIGNILKDLTQKTSFVDEVHKRLEEVYKARQGLVDDWLAHDFLSRKVGNNVDEFLSAFREAALTVLTAQKNELVTEHRVPGFGLGRKEAEKVVAELCSGMRNEFFEATENVFDEVLKHLEGISPSTLLPKAETAEQKEGEAKKDERITQVEKDLDEAAKRFESSWNDGQVEQALAVLDEFEKEHLSDVEDVPDEFVELLSRLKKRLNEREGLFSQDWLGIQAENITERLDLRRKETEEAIKDILDDLYTHAPLPPRMDSDFRAALDQMKTLYMTPTAEAQNKAFKALKTFERKHLVKTELSDEKLDRLNQLKEEIGKFRKLEQEKSTIAQEKNQLEQEISASANEKIQIEQEKSGINATNERWTEGLISSLGLPEELADELKVCHMEGREEEAKETLDDWRKKLSEQEEKPDADVFYAIDTLKSNLNSRAALNQRMKELNQRMETLNQRMEELSAPEKQQIEVRWRIETLAKGLMISEARKELSRALMQERILEGDARAQELRTAFEARIHHPLRKVAESLLKKYKDSSTYARSRQIPLSEWLVAFNIYRGSAQEVKPHPETKKGMKWGWWVRQVARFTAKKASAVVTFVPGLYYRYMVRPAISRLQHYRLWRSTRRQFRNSRREARELKREMLKTMSKSQLKDDPEYMAVKENLEADKKIFLDNRQTTLSGFLWGPIVQGVAWLWLVAFPLTCKPHEIVSFDVSSPIRGEFSRPWKKESILHPRNWFNTPERRPWSGWGNSTFNPDNWNYRFSQGRMCIVKDKEGDRDTVACPDDQDLKKIYGVTSPEELAKLSNHSFYVLYGIGRELVIPEKVFLDKGITLGQARRDAMKDTMQMLEELNVPEQSLSWLSKNPEVLLYVNEKLTGLKIVQVEEKNDKGEKAKHVILKRVEDDELLLRESRVAGFVKTLEKLEQNGHKINQELLNKNSETLVKLGFCQTFEDAKESAEKMIEWLKDKNVEERMGRTKVPAVLTYLEERTKNRELLVGKRKGKPAIFWMPSEESRANRKLDRTRGVEFVQALMALEGKGKKITLEYLRDSTEEWYSKGFLVRREDEAWANLGLHTKELTDLLEINPVLKKVVISWALHGASEYQLTKGSADKLVTYAMQELASAMEIERIITLQSSEDNEGIARMLEKFNKVPELDKLKPDEPGEQGPEKLRIRKKVESLEPEQKEQLLRTLYSTFTKAAMANNWLVHKPEVYNELKREREIARTKEKYWLKDEKTAQFVYQTPKFREFIDSLMPPRKDFALRRRMIYPLVNKIMELNKERADKKKAFDENIIAVLKPEAGKINWLVQFSYVMDQDAMERERLAKMGVKELERKAIELRKKTAEAMKEIQKKLREKEKLLAKISAKEKENNDLEGLIWTSSASKHLIKTNEKLIETYQKQLDAVEKEIKQLTDDAKKIEQGGAATANAAQFWKQPENEETAGIIRKRFDEVFGKRKKEYMDRHPELKGLSQNAVSNVAFGKVLDEMHTKLTRDPGFAKEQGLNLVDKDGQKAVEVDMRKIQILNMWIRNMLGRL